MKTYRRSISYFFSAVFALIGFLIGGVVLHFVLKNFFENPVVLYGIPGVLTILLMCFIIFDDNYHFELEEGELRYFKKNKLENKFDLKNCSVGYKINDDAIDLQIIDLKDGSETFLNCSNLGKNKFYEMFHEIEEIAQNEPEVLRATKK